MISGFGALNLDKIYIVDKIPGKDEEGYVIDLELHPGGSAANTVAGLASFGMETSFIGKTGSDEEGKILFRDFLERGVDTSGIISAEGRSGVAMIFVDKDGNRAILVDPGVNDTISIDEVNMEIVEKSSIVHMTSFICKNGLDSFRSQIKVAKRASSVSFDPGMPYIERGLKELRPILKQTAIFMPNRTEIEMLFGMGYRESCSEAMNMGVEIVAVKLGGKGCYVTDGKREYHVKAFSSNPVDTTGAGDAFNAGFLYAWHKKRNIEECARIGNFVAGKLIERVGARSYDGINPEKAL